MKWLLRIFNKKKDYTEEMEDMLKTIYSMENKNIPFLIPYLVGKLNKSREDIIAILKAMMDSKYIASLNGPLSKEGKAYALQIIRKHRIYETYLAETSGLPADRWHKIACRLEHKLTQGQIESIAQRLGNPRFDPHGDPIPSVNGDYIKLNLIPLYVAKNGQIVRVQRVEDYPMAVFRQIQHIGILPGCVFKVLDKTHSLINILFEGEKYSLTIDLAYNILIDNDFNINAEDWLMNCQRLTKLTNGKEATIVGLSPSCRGVVRRRLLDLGFVSGSTISIDLHSPLGNPTAYVVRGTAIALRKEQAKYVLISNK